MIEKEFIPYELALELKQLGFDELCFAFYTHNGQLARYMNPDKDWNSLNSQLLKNSKITVPDTYTAPTYSQAFRWFRENYKLASHSDIKESTHLGDNYYYQITNYADFINESTMFRVDGFVQLSSCSRSKRQNVPFW